MGQCKGKMTWVCNDHMNDDWRRHGVLPLNMVYCHWTSFLWWNKSLAFWQRFINYVKSSKRGVKNSLSYSPQEHKVVSIYVYHVWKLRDNIMTYVDHINQQILFLDNKCNNFFLLAAINVVNLSLWTYLC
jgi:hypothetical protein